MLRWRLIAAAGIIAPVLFLLWLDDQYNFGHPGIWFASLAAASGILCSLELVGLFEQTGVRINGALVATASLVAILFATIHQFWQRDGVASPLGTWGWSVLGLVSATAIVMLAELATFRSGEQATQRIALCLLAIFYAVIPYTFILQLRLWSPDLLGLLSFASVPFVAKCSDAGAYFSGRHLGKHRLAPILSPKKTIEGAIGGTVIAMLASIAFFRWLLPWFCPAARVPLWWAMLGFALTVAVAGMMGDLSISLFKRDVDQKDSADLAARLGRWFGCDGLRAVGRSGGLFVVDLRVLGIKTPKTGPTGAANAVKDICIYCTSSGVESFTAWRWGWTHTATTGCGATGCRGD